VKKWFRKVQKFLEKVRKEYKFKLTNEQLFKLKSSFLVNFEKLHNSRNIKSLYFDNDKFDLYFNSIINDANNFRIRFRRNIHNKIDREIKKNTNYGKQKIIEPTEFICFKEISDTEYLNRIYYPSLFVEYEREYFRFENLRVTLDSKIKFKDPKEILSHEINFNILEYKILNPNLDIEIEKYFFTNPTSFSKYKYGIKKIYNK